MAFFPSSGVVARAAIIYLSITAMPVMSWVVRQQNLTPYAILTNGMIRNYRQFHALSLDPSSKSTTTRQRESFLSITSRLHMSHDREKGDDTDQTSSLIASSLTSKMLSLRFRDVFAHFRSLPQTSDQSNGQIVNIPQESTIRMNLLRTRHTNLELNKCHIDISTIPDAGYGVYATKDLQRNELITLYPGDAIIQWKHKDHIDPGTDDGIQIFFGTHIPEAERIIAALDNKSSPTNDDSINDNSNNAIFMNHIPTARSYEVRINDTISVIGDPNRNSDPAYLGHMINDYCTINNLMDTNTNNDTSSSVNNNNNNNNNNNSIENEAIQQYNIQSIQKSNCQIQIGIDQCHVEIVATRNIKAGHELFLSYGSNYWLSRCTTATRTSLMPSPLKGEGTKRRNEATTSNNKPGFGNNIVGGKFKSKRK